MKADALRELGKSHQLWTLRTELEMLPNILANLQPQVRQPSVCHFQAVQRCHLHVVGAAEIQDARSSQIDADTIIVFGSLVGGFASARDRLEAGILGALEGTETSVEVRMPHGRIAARTVYPGVVMAAAGERRQVAARGSNVSLSAAR